MLYYYPDYFKDFECVPGKECPDSCCYRWQIVVDPVTLEKYKRVKGPIGDRMREKIDFETGRISPHGEDNRCEFLNDDNLCDIILELGEDYLCHTCTTHPRHEEVFPNMRERSLALTCPVFCKQLLERKKKVKILKEEEEELVEQLITDVERSMDFSRFDYKLFNLLVDVRDTMIKLAQNRDIDIYKRLVIVLAFGHFILPHLCPDI